VFGHLRNFVRYHKKLTLAISLAALPVAWLLSASPRGYLAARFDLAQGHHVVQTFGLPVPWKGDYVRLIRERYGVEDRTVAGCMVSPWLESYVHAYNSVSIAAIKRKFGHDVFAECAADASKAWEEHRAPSATPE
jgi:hypothetical protein